MGQFVRNFKETFDFDGDTINVTLKQLKRVDAMELMPAMAGMQGMDPKKPETMTKENIDKSNSFVDIAAHVIQDGGYIVKINGMVIEDEQVTPDSDLLKEVLTDFYFTGFVSIIATLLLKHSSITPPTEKKSGVQSSDISEELPEAEQKKSSTEDQSSAG